MHKMFGHRPDHLEVPRVVVGLVAVPMVNLLSGQKPAAQLLFRDEPMLVGVAPDVREVMVRPYADEDVALRGSHPSALPEPVLCPLVPARHGSPS